MERELTIQEAARATGISAHTLRYYERAGLLRPIDRNSGGHRRYQQRDLDALLFLSRLRAMGMPIHQVRHYAELVREGSATVPARHELLQRYRTDLCRRIAELEGNLTVLDYKIGLYASGWTPGDPGDPRTGELRDLCAPKETV